MTATRKRCRALIYVRDDYRHKKGRGFVVHYRKDRCSRPARSTGFCWQHDNEHVVVCPWAEGTEGGEKDE